MREYGSNVIDVYVKRGLFWPVYLHSMHEIPAAGELQDVSKCHCRNGENLEGQDLLRLAGLAQTAA